jgi:hypothetical protein
MTAIEKISARAKKIRAASPNKSWAACIKQASAEYRKENTVSGTLKKGKTAKSLKMNPAYVDKSQQYYRYKGREYEILEDMEGALYILVSGKAVYFKKPYTKIGAISKGSKQPRSVKHKDTLSHNTNITVLSGFKAKPAPISINGVNKLMKNGYYVEQNVKTGALMYDVLFQYVGRNPASSGAYPFRFKVYFKARNGGYGKPVEYDISDDNYSRLIRIKKPTAKELSIGHLKLLK